MQRRGSGWLAVSLLLAVSLVLGACLASAPSAGAGVYHVYSCRTPSGESAPADGWSGSVAAGGAYDDYATNTCAQGGALTAALGDLTIHIADLDQATWTFSTPANDTMVGATLWRAGDADGGEATNATYEFWLAGPSENKVFDSCVYQFKCTGSVGDIGRPLSDANRVVVPNANLGTHLYLNAACGGDSEFKCPSAMGDANGYAAVVYLYAADVTLEQSAGPTAASNVGGELASAGAVSGTSDVTFSAKDEGAGVWEAVFSVDGKVVQSTVPNENGGKCKNVGQTTDGLAAFLYLQPCPQAVSADVPFDTTNVSNGAHHLIVSVIDAAGNSAPVLDREIDVNNPVPVRPGPPNGTNASTQAILSVGWVGAKKARIASAYGRARTIAGRLTGPGGVPIGGALIDETATPRYAGAQPLAMASPRTGPDGRFEVRLPRGESSRSLTFAYRAHLGDALPVATRTLTLGVRAGV